MEVVWNVRSKEETILGFVVSGHKMDVAKETKRERAVGVLVTNLYLLETFPFGVLEIKPTGVFSMLQCYSLLTS